MNAVPLIIQYQVRIVVRADRLRYLGRVSDRMRYEVMDSPIGPLTLVSSEGGLRSIEFGRSIPNGAVPDAEANHAVVRQLGEYFARSRQEFDVDLDLAGTLFQLSVWRELLKIPYGGTRSYGRIARDLGKPGAARAVGLANHDNPIPIIIPCHRVIGQDGSLAGYGGGLDTKQQLLTLEGALAQKEHKAAGATARGRSTVSQPALFA